ncbi:MAG: hypothetical protein AAF821_23365 [Cyanobacteria bacterium P01_D01_bin.156]
MSCHDLNESESDSSQWFHHPWPLSKQLPLLLFTHMLLLNVAQTVTHIVAPTAKPPARPAVRNINKRMHSNRKQQMLKDEQSPQQLDTSRSLISSDT